MKVENTRNFEADILSTNKRLCKKRCRTIRQRMYTLARKRKCQ